LDYVLGRVVGKPAQAEFYVNRIADDGIKWFVQHLTTRFYIYCCGSESHL